MAQRRLKPIRYIENVTLDELHILKRIRQLFNQGERIIIIDRQSTEKPVIKVIKKLVDIV